MTASARPRARSAHPLLVSVVVPVRNEEQHIEEQLQALAAQTYPGAWEVLIVDNGCTDSTVARALKWKDRLPGLRIERVAGGGLNRARNAGTDAASGDLLAFCDGDDVVAPGWLEALAAAARDADIVGGSLEEARLNEGAQVGWPHEPRNEGLLTGGHRFLPFVPGGNCAVWRDVALGLRWDERYRFGSSDKEFSWRAQLASYRLAAAPDAVLHRRLRPDTNDQLRQHFRYGLSHPRLYRGFRRHGMPRSDLRQAAQEWGTILTALPRAIRSPSTHKRVLAAGARRLGRLLASVRFGVFFP